MATGSGCGCATGSGNMHMLAHACTSLIAACVEKVSTNLVHKMKTFKLIDPLDLIRSDLTMRIWKPYVAQSNDEA